MRLVRPSSFTVYEKGVNVSGFAKKITIFLVRPLFGGNAVVISMIVIAVMIVIFVMMRFCGTHDLHTQG